jgi:hypothetical protein
MLPRLSCPLKFDEVTALEAAVLVFGEKRYEETSLY